MHRHSKGSVCIPQTLDCIRPTADFLDFIEYQNEPSLRRKGSLAGPPPLFHEPFGIPRSSKPEAALPSVVLR